MTIEFGAEIEVNGKQPEWLADDVTVKFVNSAAYSDTRTVGAIAFGTKFGVHVTYIRLPADHFAYKAIERGFEPWGGGNAAPEDWDGGEVLFRDGTIGHASGVYTDPCSICWQDDGTTEDIIGYRKKATPQPQVDIIGYRKKAAPQPLADATPQPTDQTLTIRITGPQGSGKTRWAEMLRDLIPAMTKIGFPVPVVVDAGEEG